MPTDEEIGKKIVEAVWMNEKHGNVFFSSLQKQLNKLNAKTTKEATKLYDKILSILDLKDDLVENSVDNLSKVNKLMLGIDKIQVVYRREYGKLIRKTRKESWELVKNREDKITKLLSKVNIVEKSRTIITKGNKTLSGLLNQQGYKRVNQTLEKWKNFVYDMFYVGVTRGMSAEEFKSLFYTDVGTLKIGSALPQEVEMETMISITEQRTAFLQQRAKELGYKYCWNSNPMDMRTKPECISACLSGVITEAEMGSVHGFPPRHICRCEVVYTRGKWTGVNKGVNSAIAGRRLQLLDELKAAPNQMSAWMRLGKEVHIDPAKDAIRAAGMKRYKDIEDKIKLIEGKKVPGFDITKVPVKKFGEVIEKGGPGVGEPLDLYMGSAEKTILAEIKKGKKEFWFTSDKRIAGNYGPNIHKTQVRMKNPKIIRGVVHDDELAEIVKAAKLSGYDGVIVQRTKDGMIEHITAVVFNPKQIITKVPGFGVEELSTITGGAPGKTAKEILEHYEKSKNATFIKGKTAEELKADIAKRLSKKMDDLNMPEWKELVYSTASNSERAVEELIRGWAATSGDKNPSSIMMQLAAQKEFGLKGASLWWNKEALAEATTRFKKWELPLRRFLREMYNDTQEHLAKQGLKTVRVTRGVKTGKLPTEALELPSGIKPSTITNKMSEADVKLQPMSSFSSDFSPAQAFGNPATAERASLYFAEVPADRVLSCPITGFGCLDEAEWIILGSQKAEEKMLESLIGRYYKGTPVRNWRGLFESKGVSFEEAVSKEIAKRTE